MVYKYMFRETIMRRHRRARFIWFCICFLLLTTSISAIAQFRGADRPQLVSTQTLAFEYETNLVEAVGTAEARRSVTLYASVSDEVTSINFRPGQFVEKGEVLVELDSRLQDVAIDRAKIELKNAQINLERVKASVAKGAVTERELDDANTAFQLAEINLREAQENKEDRLIRAPFDGIVGLTDVEIGDRIDTQTMVTTLDNREQLFVNFVAPESAVNYLLQKPNVTLQPWSNREQTLKAEITQIDSRIDIQNRTIRARALLDNKTDAFRPGMSFRVTIEIRGERYIAIPEAALSWGASGAFVWLAESERAKRVPVQVKQRLRGRILVSGELTDGEQLIVEGIQGLRQDQPLNIVNESQTNTQISQKKTNEEVAG